MFRGVRCDTSNIELDREVSLQLSNRGCLIRVPIMAQGEKCSHLQNGAE